MDQGRIAGLGNIQVAEALFLAGIHPARRADRLSKEEVRRLHRAIRRSLEEGLQGARAPEISYLEEAGAENPFRVYAREGEPCPRCGTRLGRFTQAGRSSYFCRRCQPAPRGRR
jgi:formamidopyrimidine-DNA glycosylase